ncbi:hypothetical protein BDV59DRAFT_59914 [Aspergillus ambiguus]|uniref:uncharacterized protein n=1 Tax=Aspergillus ambiguus TaxID=176160 RepID=UPI003CCDEEDC
MYTHRYHSIPSPPDSGGNSGRSPSIHSLLFFCLSSSFLYFLFFFSCPCRRSVVPSARSPLCTTPQPINHPLTQHRFLLRIQDRDIWRRFRIPSDRQDLWRRFCIPTDSTSP